MSCHLVKSVSSFLPLARIAGKIDCGIPTQRKVRLRDPYWSAHTGKQLERARPQRGKEAKYTGPRMWRQSVKGEDSYTVISGFSPNFNIKNNTQHPCSMCPACFFHCSAGVLLCCLPLAHVNAASDVSLKSLHSIMHYMEWSYFKRWALGPEPNLLYK